MNCVSGKHKFARQSGGTTAISKRTLSADEVIGEILDSNYAFIPIAIGPFGDIGSLFMRFWDGSDTLPLPNFTKACPNALRAAKRATAVETPWDILGKADAQWKKQRGSSLFEGSYLSPTPSIWANQQLGLVCCTQLANHIQGGLETKGLLSSLACLSVTRVKVSFHLHPLLIVKRNT
jgi:hypothetical protein